MAAFTEGYTDTTKPGKDHIGSMISKVLAARKFARQEREAAEEKAKKAGYDSLEEAGVEKGFFFKAALKNKFGGSYISGKKQDIEKAVDRVKLLKNPKAQFWNFVDNRDADGKDIKKLSDVERFRKQFDNYNFQSAKRPAEGVKAETPAIPKKLSPFELEQKRQSLSQEKMLAETEKKVAAAASGNKQRASREDLLQAINAIAQSLDKTAQSINNSIGDSKQVASDVHAMKTDIVNQLSERTDSIEDKLTKIAEAINAQTALKKKTDDQAEGTASESNLEKQNDVARDITYDNTSTDIDESKFDTDQLDYNPESNTPPSDESSNVKEGPQAERGAILSGPDSGYKVPGLTLHGNEAIVPLDNNYTQGEPSAVDGKVRPTPSEPMVPPMNVNVNNSYEMGTPMGKSSPIEIPNLMGDSSLEQPLVDAMALPTKIAGGMALAASSELVKRLSGDSPEVASEMAKVITPLASVFDLPKSLVGKAKAGEGLKKEPSILTGGGEKEEKKNIFQKAFEGLKDLFKGGKKKDPKGGPGSTNPAGAKPGAGTMSAGGEEGLGNFIGSKESGNSYTKLVGGAEDASILDKTVSQLNSEKGGQFAMGKYQIQMRTASEVLRNAGKDPDKFKFDQQGQDEIFRLLLERRGVDDYISGKISEDEFALNLSKEWAALPMNASGAGYYDGDGKNKSLVSYEETIKMIRGLKESATTVDEVPGQPNSAPEITDNYGLNQDQSFDFSIPGRGNYKAYKTATGFEIFRYGGLGSLIGRDTKIDTTDGKNSWAVAGLIKAGEARQEAAKKITPPPKPEPPVKPDQTQAMRGSTAAEKAQVAMINIGGEQTQSAATGAVPTSQGTTVAPAVSSLSKSVFTVDGVTT